MKRALIVGRASRAMDDYEAALAFGPYDEVLVVGKMLEVFPHPAGHAVSFHSCLFGKWADARSRNGFPPVGSYWGAPHRGRPMYPDAAPPGPFRRVEQRGGSSGMIAVQVAVDELKCERVVLAGVPMEAGASHCAETLAPEKRGEPWKEADVYWETWLEREDWLREHVRSMSGRTREYFGEPTRAWLEDH